MWSSELVFAECQSYTKLRISFQMKKVKDLITFHPHYKNFRKVDKLWQTIINSLKEYIVTN